jgi:hypothetical protein
MESVDSSSNQRFDSASGVRMQINGTKVFKYIGPFREEVIVLIREIEVTYRSHLCIWLDSRCEPFYTYESTYFTEIK